MKSQMRIVKGEDNILRMVKPPEVTRHASAVEFNKIVNDPSVYDWVRGGYEGYLDMTPVVDDPSNILLMGKHGGVLCIRHQPGLYEAHTSILPSGRGKWALDWGAQCFHWMFTKTDAVEIVTRVPFGNVAAKALTKRTHGVLEFRRESGWVKNGQPIPADIYSWKIQDWMRTAPGLVKRGQWFHDRLEEEFRRLGKKHDSHPQCDLHDRYVGVTIDMIMGGQPQKAVVFYNRWAKMAGYGTIEIATFHPLTIDIRDALLAIRNNDFWVIACQQPQL